MSTRILYRWSGIVLLIGSLIGVINTILEQVLFPGNNLTAQQILSTPFLVNTLLFLAWAILIVMGLPGLYLRQATRAGMPGFIGYVLVSLGLLLAGVAFAAMQFTIFPYLAQSAPKLIPTGGNGPIAGLLLLLIAPALLITIGDILLGIATIRVRVFPRWTGILLIAAGALFLLSSIPTPFADILTSVSNIAFFVALAWCGSQLIARERGEVETTPFPAEVQASR